VRCTGDDDAAVRRRDAVAGRQSVRPHDGFVHDSVAIGVAQEFHGAVGFGLGLLLGRLAGLDATHFQVELAGFVQLVDVVLPFDVVAVQFADKAAALVIPADAGWLVDERFAGEEADLIACGQLKLLRAFGWRERLWRIVRAGDFGQGGRSVEKRGQRDEAQGVACLQYNPARPNLPKWYWRDGSPC
jgi:hypothetical protein